MERVVTAGLICCAQISQCTTDVRPHPAQESNKCDSGQVRLLKPAILHTHTHTSTHPPEALVTTWFIFNIIKRLLNALIVNVMLG